MRSTIKNIFKKEKGVAGVAAILVIFALVSILGIMIYTAQHKATVDSASSSAVQVTRDTLVTLKKLYAQYAPVGLSDLDESVTQVELQYIPVYGGKKLADYVGEAVVVGKDGETQLPYVRINFTSIPAYNSKEIGEEIKAKLGGEAVIIYYDKNQNTYTCKAGNVSDTDDAIKSSNNYCKNMGITNTNDNGGGNGGGGEEV